MKLLVKNGLVIDPVNKIQGVMDVLASGGKKFKGVKGIKGEGGTMFQATGKKIKTSIRGMARPL